MESSVIAAELDKVVRDLQSFRYRFNRETDLHDRIQAVLTTLGVDFEHEVQANPTDRFDFLIAKRIVVEVKVKGSFPDALRQADRYCLNEKVQGVIIASTTRWGSSVDLDTDLHGKPVRVAFLQRIAF